MFALATFFIHLPFYIPSLALPTVRNNVPFDSTAPALKRETASVKVFINVPIYTSMFSHFFNQDDSNASVLVGPGTIGLQIWEDDVVGHEWKISEKAISDDGDANVDAWSLQCHLSLTSPIALIPHSVFTLSPKSPFINSSVDSDVVLECNGLRCLKDNGCDKDYDPSFNSISLRN
ncbi:hypothetical protein I308_104453 [Cryptococcus tetragattii IND107]|uniref:Uncharacterized protein n=1 Tax=Cryptococcus tetragattii IND107 TaxID=1296105 RepID=A0ABR3BRC9_9TREE|nr:hypothetical protein I308_01044 [Cryptococcus tetragattii IND107]